MSALVSTSTPRPATANPERSIEASLHHLALSTENPEALAHFYGQALGLEIVRKGEMWIGHARERRLIFVSGKPKSLSHAAYAVADRSMLDALKRRLDGHAWSFESIEAEGLQPGAIRVADPDGNHFIFGLEDHEGAEALFDGAANRPARLQHVVMASRNASRLAAFFETHIGFVLSDTVVDTEGNIRTSFLRCGHEHHNFAVFQAPEDRLDHHCYEAGDWSLIRDWGDHMASHHIPLKWGPGRHGPGHNLFMFIHDPDGNWVEISAELEQVAPDRPVGEWPHEEYTLNRWGQGLLRS